MYDLFIFISFKVSDSMDLTSSSRLRPSSMEADRMSTDRMSTADLSEAESDTSSVMGDTSSFDSSMKPPSPASREHMQKRIESLKQVIFSILSLFTDHRFS